MGKLVSKEVLNYLLHTSIGGWGNFQPLSDCVFIVFVNKTKKRNLTFKALLTFSWLLDSLGLPIYGSGSWKGVADIPRG